MLFVAIGKTTTHTIQSGESLAVIANQYDTTVEAISEANDIDNPNLIQVGQKLVISGQPEVGEVQKQAASPNAITSIRGMLSDIPWIFMIIGLVAIILMFRIIIQLFRFWYLTVIPFSVAFVISNFAPLASNIFFYIGCFAAVMIAIAAITTIFTDDTADTNTSYSSTRGEAKRAFDNQQHNDMLRDLAERRQTERAIEAANEKAANDAWWENQKNS